MQKDLQSLIDKIKADIGSDESISFDEIQERNIVDYFAWEVNNEKGRSALFGISQVNASDTPLIINNKEITINGSSNDTLQNIFFGMSGYNVNLVNNSIINLNEIGFYADTNVDTWCEFEGVGSHGLGLAVVDFNDPKSLVGDDLNISPVKESRSFSIINNGTIRITLEDNLDFSKSDAWFKDDEEDTLTSGLIMGSNRENFIMGFAIDNIYVDNLYQEGNKTAKEIISLQDMITGVNKGTIDIEKGSGVYATGSKFTNEREGLITVGSGIGIQAALATVVNKGTITVNGKLYTGNLYDYSGSGIVAGSSTIVNAESGVINVVDGYGIYAEDSVVENYGTINVTTGIGIKGLGTTTIYNAGTINAPTSIEGNVVQSGQYNSETGLQLSAQTFTAMAGSETNAQNYIMGSATIDKGLVANGFDSTYIGKNMFNAPDTSQLKLVSNSALFDARLAENGSDVIMTKKAFNTLTPNNSLASFLEQNYALGHNEAFYNELKNLGSALDFQKGLNNLTGKEVLDRFSYEDLTAVREMNLAMNQQMFANEDKNIFTTQGNLNQFSFKNGKASSGQFALSNKKISPNLRVGYAMSVTRLNTNDEGHNNTRNASLFQMAIPFHFNGNGVKMISTPMAGFARGHYSRTGFNDTSYKGTIEKRLFGVMNEIRYPLSVGGFELSPTIELNAIAYNQRGGEEHKPYSLTIQSENNLSVEAGVGLYAAKQYDLSSEAKLNLNAGMMLYREFADPYNMKLGMQGMSGHFDLYDEDRSSYRGVARLGLDYQTKDLDIYGSIQHYMEDDPHTNVKSGFKWKF